MFYRDITTIVVYYLFAFTWLSVTYEYLYFTDDIIIPYLLYMLSLFSFLFIVCLFKL